MRKLPGNYHNIPQRYIDKFTKFISIKYPNFPQYEQKVIRYKKKAYYDEWRPWERNFEILNKETTKVRKIFIQPYRIWSFFRGDRVQILRGKDTGKQGIVNYIVKERNWVYVEGLNLVREKSELGIVLSKEQPLLINEEVKLVDPSDLQPCDFEWRQDDKGDLIRVSVRTEREIPIPLKAYETIDYTERKTYKEGSKDTPAKAANLKTFEPKSKTFEMDICDSMGIKEDRVPYPIFWY